MSEPTCDVQYNQGFTLNMGNFQSARVDVSITYTKVPVEQRDAKLTEASDRVKEILKTEALRLKGA